MNTMSLSASARAVRPVPAPAPLAIRVDIADPLVAARVRRALAQSGLLADNDDPDALVISAPAAPSPSVEWSADRPRLSQREQEVAALTRTWEDRLLERLVALHGEEKGRALWTRWADRLPEYYKSSTDVYRAVLDVEHLDELTEGDDVVVALQNDRGHAEQLPEREGLAEHHPAENGGDGGAEQRQDGGLRRRQAGDGPEPE